MSDLIDRNPPSAETHEERMETHACDLISRQAAIDTDGLDEEIRCEMCKNPTHTDRGCDGNCRYDEKLYKKIIQLLNKRITPLPPAQPYTEAEIQTMQELEQAELQKAYECGRASALPEIIRCKDCKHYEGGWYCSAWNNSPGFPIVTEKGYCNLAERREE